MSDRSLDDSELQTLVAQALEVLGRGEEVDLVALCSQRPDLRESVAASLETAFRMPLVQAQSTTRDRASGTVLADRYELRSRLGAGAMGVVYQAFDRELQRPVAVKVLRTLLVEGSEAEERFQREAEALAAVRHSAVVAVYDRGHTHEQDPFLVMELLEGTSLAELLDAFDESAEGPGRVEVATITERFHVDLGEERSYLRLVVRWAAKIAEGLEAAHAAGIFHRDVKPSNVFVQRDGRPVLLDFGIAAHAAGATLTREGAALGTPAYMAPEALAAERAPSATLDVYGLSATLYHLLTLHSPYVGSPSQILTALAVKEPVRASKLRPGLPRDLQAILDRGMARRAADRYQTAAALARDLHAFLDHRPVVARPLSPVVRVWRRAWASNALRGAVLVALLGLTAMVTVSWRSHLRDQRAQAFREAWQRVGGNFTLGNPAYRTFAPALERELAAILDEAVDHADDPVPARVVRAAFRLDHGEPAGAADDMAVVARWVGSAYATALRAAYEALGPEADGAEDLDLSACPEPDLALDHYLAAFHARRMDRRADVRALLAHPGLADHVPSLELQLAYLVGERSPQAVDVVERIEREYGGRTAATAHWLGTYHFVGTRDYERAASVLRQGIERNDMAHALQVYGGWSLMKLGRCDESLPLLRRAQEIRPDSPGGYELEARALIELREFDAARAVIEDAPYGTGVAAEAKREQHLAELEAEEALEWHRAGDEEAARERARSAVARFDRAEALGHDVQVPRRGIARALAQGEERAVFFHLAQVAREREAVTPEVIRVVRHWMPNDLSAKESAELAEFLERLAD